MAQKRNSWHGHRVSSSRPNSPSMAPLSHLSGQSRQRPIYHRGMRSGVRSERSTTAESIRRLTGDADEPHVHQPGARVPAAPFFLPLHKCFGRSKRSA